MERKSGLILSFIIGAAAGAAIGYLLAGGKSDELMSDVKDAANKVKDEFEKQFEKGKDFLSDIKSMTDHNT